MKILAQKIIPQKMRISGFNALTLTALVTTSLFTCRAVDINWLGGTASYTNAADWSPATVPGLADYAINDQGSNNAVQINAGDGDWTVNGIWAGTGGGNGAFEQNGQNVNLNGTNYNGPVQTVYTTPFRLGIAAGDTGVYTLNGGTNNYGTGGFNVGELGTGFLNINGGLITGSGNFAANLGVLAAPTAVTATVGNGMNEGDYTWFEQGLYAANPAIGLPPPGTTIVSVTQADHSYTLASSYTANDAVLISTNVASATITPTTPAVCSGLSFLGTAGHGPAVVQYTLHFADTTTETGSISFPDWFASGTKALGVGGRVDALGLNFQTWGAGGTNLPYLWSLDVVVTNSGSAVTSIDLAYTSGGVASVLGVSSSTGADFTPMSMTGYNADVIVEAGGVNYVANTVTNRVNQTGGAVNVTGGGQLFIGNYGNSIYNLSGGSVDVHNYIALGRSSGNGTLNLTGGSFNQDGGGNILVGTGFNNNGNLSVGVLNQSAGTINSQGQFLCPENSPSSGTYNLSGTGVLNVNDWFVIGRQGGSGVMNISGSAVINKAGGGDFIVCDGNNESGTVVMDGGTFNASNGWFRVGNGGGAQASFTQNGGTVRVLGGQFLVPDHGDGSSLATYSMSGTASLTVNDWLAIGRGGGAGVLNITNGSVTKTGNAGNHMIIGAGGTGTLNQEGGAITNTTSDFWLAEAADGTWNMNAGMAVLSVLHICQNAGSQGNLFMNGGDLFAQEITTGNVGGGSFLYLNGGTIHASADNPNFLHGLTVTYVDAGGVTFDSQGFNIGVAQGLNDYGGGGVTKNGSGTLTFSGVNSYSGPTVVNVGTLATTTDSTGQGSYSVADNAGLGVTVTYANASLYMASLTFAGSTAATLNIDLGAFGNPTTAPVTDNSDLVVNGTVTINIADSQPNYGQFPLIQYSGAMTGAGGFVLGSLPLGVGAYLSNNVAGNSIDLVITNVNLPRWEGLAGGDWDIGLTTNWVNVGDGMPTFYAEGNKVLFNDNALGTTTVNLAASVHPNGVTVDNGSLPYAFTGTGKISGAAGLTKQGTGTLVITNAGGNDYTGPTVIAGGVLNVTSLADGLAPSPIGASSSDPANLVLAGGTLTYSGPATSINRGYSVQGDGSAIDTENNLALSGVVAATGTNGFSKIGPAQLAYMAIGSNVLSGAGSSGYIVQNGTVAFDGSAGGQTNIIQGDRLGVDGLGVNASVVLTNTTLNLGGNLDLGNIADTTGAVIVNSNATLNVGSWFVFGDGGNSGGTFTLNGGTLNVNNGTLLMGGRPGAMSTLNLNGGALNKSGGTVIIAPGNWNADGARTGIVNQVDGTFTCSDEIQVGQAAQGTGIYNLHGGTLDSTGWFVIGRAGGNGTMIMDGGTLNHTSGGQPAFIVGSGAGNDSLTSVALLDQSGGTINCTSEYWVAENTATVATNNISGTAVVNVANWVSLGRRGHAVINFSGGTFTKTGSGQFIIGEGGGNCLWNQTGGTLNIGSELWIGQAGGTTGEFDLSAGVVTNNSWLAVGREGGTGTLNISGTGRLVKAGGGNTSIAHGGGTGTVNVSGNGSIDTSSGETWIGEDSNMGTWNMNGGTATAGYVQITRNANATGSSLNLNGGTFGATEITTGNTGGTSTLNFNGGTLAATGDNTNFMHDLTAANVQTGGALIDSSAHIISVNQALLGDVDDGGLTKMGGGTLYLNGANTYTNATLVNAGALGGSGTIQGSVTVASGARLSPGTASIGTLTINNSLSLATGSSTLVKVSMDGGATNDVVSGLTDISYGGTLVVTNAGASPLVPGTQFQLFNTASRSGNFADAASVTILPAGKGTFDPATGKLTITSSGVVAFNPVTVSGGNLILTGDGGAAPGSAYTLLTTTNVATPLSMWTTNTTGVLDGSGMFSNNIPIESLDAARFFDVRVP